MFLVSTALLTQLLTLVGLQAAPAHDLSLGTWERNPQESKSSGPDPWRRQTVVREAAPGGVKQTVTEELHDGTRRTLSFTMRYDGTPVRVAGAPPAWDTVAMRLIDAHTSMLETYDSRGGKYRVSGQSTISRDGSRMVSHQQGTGVNGEPLECTVVFDRVIPAPKVESWSREQLTKIDGKVTSQVSGARPSFEVLVRTPSSVGAVLHRAKTGEAELHEEMADFLVIRAGSATLVTGGRLIGRRPVPGQGEFAGDRVEGGESRKLMPGDIVHVPPNVPHHVVLAQGETVTYLLIKAKE